MRNSPNFDKGTLTLTELWDEYTKLVLFTTGDREKSDETRAEYERNWRATMPGATQPPG